MTFNRLKFFALLCIAGAGSLSLCAQGYSFNCARDTILPGCPPTACFTIKTLIPDPHRQSTNYSVGSPVTLPTCLLAANNPATPGLTTNISVDDRYSDAYAIGFPFIFFGTPYNDIVVSSNGYVTFDVAEANQASHWNIINGATPQNLPSTFYDRALIMGPYHDIDMAVTTSPNRRISFTRNGIAPYRTWVLNYYKIPLFSAACNNLIENTHQIILYESTGIIDVNIFDKEICGTWNQGRAMIGVQNFNRDIGVMVNGRRATDPPWGAIGMNERYRFIPIGGTPLFRRVELYDMANNLVSTGTTVQLPNGDREASFPNVCPPPGVATQYVVKGFYDKIDDPATEIYGLDTITVNRTNPLAATPATSSSICGQNTGSITVNNVSGGTGPYEYSLDGVTWQSSNVFNGLAAGTYTVYVRDAPQTCAGSYTVTVGNISNLSAISSNAATSCSGVNNGSITITPTLGTAPYNYVIDGGAPVSGGSPYTFTGLAAGTHIITFTDANGCASNSISVTVTNGAGMTGQTSTAVPTSCAGATNGSITVTGVTGGTAPYQYQLDAGPLQSSNTFSGLASGTYTITIRDAVGCTRTFTRTVTAGSSVTATRTLTATSCPTAADGSVTITPTSGTGPYEFSLDGGPFVAGPAPFTFSGLTAGAHNFVVRDLPTGCLSLTINFTILSGPGINASAAPAATSCNGAANGSVTVTATTGTGPYSFVLDGGAPVSGPSPYTFNGLSSGNHTVVVSDAGGCASGTINFNVAVGPTLAANAVPAATSCSGATNGSITVTPTNGTGPYSYSLDGGAFVPGPSPYTFSNLSAGNHTITVTEIATGCVTNVIPVTVDAGPVLVTSASKTDVLCNGGNTGTITVAQPAIGVAPFEYSLDGINWQTSNVFNGLTAGVYNVRYREANGCQNNLSITVDEPAVLSFSASSVPVVCNGQSNGIINTATSGGMAPYEYSIDGGTNWQSSPTFNVPAGNYTVIIRDANGCTTSQNINVAEPVALSAISANTNASCDGGNDGVIAVTATGGNSSYEYSLDGTTWQSGNTFNVAPGNYTVYVRDNLGCNTSFPTSVGLTNNLTFTQQTDPVICESKSTQLDLVSNATQYAWSPATGLSSTTIHNPVANPVVTTQYIVTATLGRCAANDTVIVNVNAAPIPNAGVDGFICYGQNYQLNATGGVQYKWTPSTYLDDPNSPSPLATPTKDITYTVTIIADANGCASLVTDNITIDVTPPIKIKTYPFDTVVYEMDQFQMLAVPSDPDVINFNWTPSTGLDNPSIANPTVTAGTLSNYIANTTNNEILYQVIGSTVAGCIGEGYVKVRVYKGPDIYVPTGFTPNGDGRNDRFVPFPVGIKSLTYFRVYNRWGQMVFSTSRLHDGWDGVFMGVAQPSGSYVWMAEAITEQGRTITRKGTTTIIR